MVDGNLIQIMAENALLPTIIFVIFVLYHRSESKKWQQVTAEQNKNNERMFSLLQQEIQVIDKLGRVLERVDTKVTIGWNCPMMMRDPDEVKKTLNEMRNG